MGTAAKQLEQLNGEIAALNVEVKAASEACKSAAAATTRSAIALAGAPGNKTLQLLHDAAQKEQQWALACYKKLKHNREHLLEDIRALQAKLPSAGERAPPLPCQQHQALLDLALVRGRSSASRIQGAGKAGGSLHAVLRCADNGPGYKAMPHNVRLKL